MLKIKRSALDALKYNLDDELAAYSQARQIFSGSINVPPPVTYPLVEKVWERGGYEIIEKVRKGRVVNQIVEEVLVDNDFPAGEWVDLPNEYVPGDAYNGTFHSRPGTQYDWNGSAWVLNAERQADIDADTKYSSDATAAKGYAKYQELVNATPAEIQTWVDNNVTDMASAKDAIKTIMTVMCVLARQL